MTPPTPSRDTPAGRAYNDLRNLARRQNRDPAEYMTLYALEGFLARLAASESAADFVLKGGVLMAAFANLRPTRDIDFAARGFANDITEAEKRVRSILAVPRDDGLEFDLDSIRGEQIRDEADYNGVRVKMTARLATAQVELEPLGPLLAHMPALAQRKWEVWRKKQRLEQSSPVSFADLLATCLNFVEPVLARSVGQMQWNLSSQVWEEPTSASTERELEGSSGREV